jgi:hypothetical protein
MVKTREGEGSPVAARFPTRLARAWTFSAMWCSLVKAKTMTMVFAAAR